MKQNGRYKCEHLPGEILVATRKYNDKQFSVTSEKTGSVYLVGIDSFTEPHLCLAHVANMHCELTEIKENK